MLPRHSVLVLLVIGTVLGVMSLPRVPEPASYHCLADARSWLGVPNTLNVLSNLPFAMRGFYSQTAMPELADKSLRNHSDCREPRLH